jgi:hypothetical protein
VGTFLQDMVTIPTPLDEPSGRNVLPPSALARQEALPESASADWAEAAKLLPPGSRLQAMTRLPDGTTFFGADTGLFRVCANEILPVETPFREHNASEGRVPPSIKALAAHESGLWVGSANGLSFYTGSVWFAFTPQDGLPILDITHLALGEDNGLWIGTPQGVIRLHGGEWRYYAGRRWLPGDAVTGLAPDENGGCLVHTASGTARIVAVPMTFPQKAAHYEQITAARHNRDGYVADCRLQVAGDLDSFLYEATDNDGLWTSLYLCTESFRYAVTGEEEARQLAARSLHALLDLVRVTGIPGFPARAVVRVGERVLQSDPGPNWYLSPVEPDILYKNDTSSDEIMGHYLAWYVYSALVADADERVAIADTCRAVTDHLLDHHYTLVGPTGKRTTWGVWSPEVLNGDPDWVGERGLNSLAILSHLKVAHYLCGEARFAEAYRSLIVQHGYALNTVRQKVLPPEGENNHSDDELAACAYYPLLMLETDPDLRGLYLLSLERAQAILRPEQSPFYNFLYGAMTGGRPCDADAAVQWLRDAPWDLRHWTMRNSHRADIRLDPEPGRFGEKQARHVLSPRERRVSKWNQNPYALDGGSDGMSEEDGTSWLLPYWLGRYHGLIAEQDERGV